MFDCLEIKKIFLLFFVFLLIVKFVENKNS